MITLEEWCFQSNQDGYAAPELASYRFIGKVYGHPKHEDGTVIATSTVVGWDGSEGFTTVSGTTYTLGQPKPEYEAAYPGARERMIRQMREQHNNGRLTARDARVYPASDLDMGWPEPKPCEELQADKWSDNVK